MKETKTQTILSGERLGDEKRIQAVLAGWGMDAAAIDRILQEHRALRTKARQERKDVALRNYPASGLSSPIISPVAPRVR